MMYHDEDDNDSFSVTDEESEAYAAMSFNEQVEFLRARALEGFKEYSPESRLKILGDMSELLAEGVDPMQAFKTLFWLHKIIHRLKAGMQASNDMQYVMLSVALTGMWCQFMEPRVIQPIWAGLAENAREG